MPDLAFGIPDSQLPQPGDIRSIAGGRAIFALSPIIFAKPGSWPQQNRLLYDRYLQQMARLISQLLKRDGFLVVVWSALSDKQVISEILAHLDSDSRARLDRQMHVPAINSWRDLVSALRDADFLVASRLHSVILGFVSQCPTVAISFDPKVDWVMADLGQTDYLLQIGNFVADDVVAALDRLASRKQSVTDKIASYRRQAFSESSVQYDKLAGLARAVQPAAC